MRKPGRNELCPCGSGRKVKRCCGVDASRERARLARETAEELFGLASHFPRSRPATASFDDWTRVAPERPSDEALEAGVEAIGEDERERIVRSFAELHPEVWAGALADFGNDELAVEIVLKGAVVAGVLERRPLRPSSLLVFEWVDELSPAEALAVVSSPDDLWSVIESGEVVAALDEELADEPSDEEHRLRWRAVLERETARRLTPWHEERIDVLLDRIRDRLPAEGFPQASLLLAGVLDRLDEAGRREYAQLLLADSLDRIYDAEDAELAA